MQATNDSKQAPGEGMVRSALSRPDAGEALLSFLDRLGRFGLLAGMSPLLRPLA